MVLYRYFKRHSDNKLPDPRGPLSIKIPSTSIASANVEVRDVVGQESASRGPYVKITAEQRAVIGKRAAEHGIAAAIRFYTKFDNLKESRMHTWERSTSWKSRKGGEGDLRMSP